MTEEFMCRTGALSFTGRPGFKARLERLKAAGHTGATGRYYKDD